MRKARHCVSYVGRGLLRGMDIQVADIKTVSRYVANFGSHYQKNDFLSTRIRFLICRLFTFAFCMTKKQTISRQILQETLILNFIKSPFYFHSDNIVDITHL